MPWALFLLAVLLVVLPALMAVHAYRETRQAFHAQVQNSRLAHAAAVADHVSAALSRTAQSVRVLARLQAEQSLPHATTVRLVSEALLDASDSALSDAGHIALWMQRIDALGNVSPADVAAVTGLTISWPQLQPGWSFPLQTHTDQALALYAVPIADGETAGTAWALGSVALTDIVDDKEYASLGASGAVSLVEMDGRVRFSSDASRRGGHLHAQELIDMLASGRNDVRNYYAPRRAARQVSAVARVEGSPLYVLLSQDEQDVQQPLNRLSRLLDQGVLLVTALGLVLMVVALLTLRRRQQAMASERALQAAVLASMSAILPVRDRSGRVLFGNAAASAFLGIAPDELPGLNLGDLLDPRSACALATLDAGVLNSNASRGYAWNGHRRVSHSAFSLWTISHPLRDQHGRTTGVLSISRDTTQLDDASHRLQESEQRLRSITDHLPALISYIDCDGRYQFNNQAFAIWLDCRVEDLAGRHLADVHGQATADQVEPALTRALSTGETVSFELTLPSGTQTYACTYVPDRDAHGVIRGVYSLAMDVTEQRALEASSKRESLERTWLSVAEHEQERLGRELHDSVGQELAGASFLAKALAVRLQAEGSALAADADWVKQLLTRCVEHVRGLSRQLSPTELEHGTVLAAIDRLCTDVERSYGVHCQLRASPRARPLCSAITANAARQLYRVCQEALNNAMRHGASTRIDVRMDLRGRMLRLAIADNGTGFPSGQPLEPDAAPTTGVGLKSMRLRAHSLGGSLRVGRRGGWTLVLLRAPFGRLMFTAEDTPPTLPADQGSAHAYPGD